MHIEEINYRDWVKLPPPQWSRRERLFEFALDRWLNASWATAWFWWPLVTLTYQEPRLWSLKGLVDAGEDEDIPF
jgi:hypothetical protein